MKQVAIATVLNLNFDCCYEKQLAIQKLLTCQSLGFYEQPFGKSWGGGFPNDPLPQVNLLR